MTPRYNLLDPEFRADPYRFYAQMRRETPVCQVEPGGLWAVTRYDDVMYVLRNHQLFSSAGLRMAAMPAWLEDEPNPIADSMTLMDPPQHTRLRGLLMHAFGPPVQARLERRIREIAEELAQELCRKGEVDFVADFASPLPASVIGEVLGLDRALRSEFKRWADEIVSINAAVQESPERIARIRGEIVELKRYLREVIAARRASPRDDIMSELLRAELEGTRLSERELVAFGALLLVAGLETTSHLLALTMIALTREPGLLARVRAEPSCIPRLVEEVLRHEPPVHGTLRLTTTEVSLGGVLLPPHAPVIALIGSAARDEQHFPRADVMDIDREGQSHFAFGHGVHFCLGASLARMEARIGLEVLLARCAAFERGPHPVRWNSSFTVRGPVSLPLRVLAA